MAKMFLDLYKHAFEEITNILYSICKNNPDPEFPA